MLNLDDLAKLWGCTPATAASRAFDSDTVYRNDADDYLINVDGETYRIGFDAKAGLSETQLRAIDTKIKIVFSAEKNGVEIIKRSQLFAEFCLANLARDHLAETTKELQGKTGRMTEAEHSRHVAINNDQATIDDMLDAAAALMKTFLRIKLREWAQAQIAAAELTGL
jgi:hypothetical protein